jgi:diguanylate cyclase
MTTDNRPPDGPNSSARAGAPARVQNDFGVRSLNEPKLPALVTRSQGGDLLTQGKVMMIDDEPIMIQVVQAFLEEAGYREFVGISDPTIALARVRAERPDVLLMDLMMPKVSGFDILAALRADEALRLIPVIVITSASDATTKLRVLELGATDFLEKPVDPSELALRLRNTMAFKAYHEQVANSDALTGLPNRTTFIAQLGKAVRRAERNDSNCALLHIDLDRFKQINETLGHRVGDALLKQVSQRLQISTRSTESIQRVGDQHSAWTLSRVGGDEFVALLSDLARIEDAVTIARRVQAVMNRPFNIEGRELFVSASIGIAAYPHDGPEPEIILQHAEAALSDAKQRGRNTYSFYARGLNDEALERLTLESQLRRAQERGELRLCFQPKIDLTSGAVVGAEALIRWQHPTLGLLPPSKFIPIAEESNMIIAIGSWVLHETCRLGRSWLDQGLPPITLSVNVSSPQVRDGKLLADVTDALASSGLPPQQLMIELTESMLMGNTRENIETLQDLKGLGVGLSLDDFGTGYSSLAYLNRMPLDELKIDRSFVQGLPADSDSAAIVSAVLALATSLGLSVTAEGVETEAQRAFLSQRGCNLYQGFLCSPPVAPESFVKFMQGHAELQAAAAAGEIA